CGMHMTTRTEWCSFFFFQAEDGIRDWSVTGVQTCALPIFELGIPAAPVSVRGDADVTSPGNSDRRFNLMASAELALGFPVVHPRSEERRVGKERRSRG